MIISAQGQRVLMQNYAKNQSHCHIYAKSPTFLYSVGRLLERPDKGSYEVVRCAGMIAT
ncbi:hypothetical protein CPB83DRAFT_859969 [Crepidotus variabilis]|uniref:Uncharacterized protein n=1 Tax=Crepidotus variabilis TaxID=179855 RepID=A0A9P6EA47_9AGAR|nr:hypothetical protein CPB83DRAFT_859969 [Crepidotus variabilis]